MASVFNNLKDIFTDKDDIYLQKVLQSCGNQLDMAVDFIIAGEELSEESEGSDTDKTNLEILSPKSKGENGVITDSLLKYVNSIRFSDIILLTSDDKRIYAHQVILIARSAYFAMILQSLTPDQTECPKLENISQKMLLMILEFLYTGDVNIKNDEAYDLLCAADLLSLANLRKKCEMILEYRDRSFGDQLLKTLNDPTTKPDVTLKVQDNTILCHKLILSSGCEYFNAMFGGKMAESHMNQIIVPDTPYDIFYQLLRVIYSNGTITKQILCSENALDLFLLANRFIVPNLQYACENFIKESLDLENVCQILELTGTMSASLKFMCQQFIYTHYEEVTPSDNFKNLNHALKAEMEQNYENFKNETIEALLNQIPVEELSYSLKGHIALSLSKKIHFVTLNDVISDVINSPVGEINFKLSHFELVPIANSKLIRDKDILVDFSRENLEIKIIASNLALQMTDINWEYSMTEKQQQLQQQQQQNKSPEEGETKGVVTAIPEGTLMTVTLRIVPHKNGIPQLSIKEISFLIENFELDFDYDQIPAWVVELCYNELQKHIKERLQEEIVSIINEAIISLIKSLNAVSRGEFQNLHNNTNTNTVVSDN